MGEGVSEPASRPQFPAWVVRDWQEAVVRVSGQVPAQLLWDRVLTADDRRRLGGQFAAAFARENAPRMWRRLRGISYPQAVVAVGTALGLIDPAKGRALLEWCGEAADDPSTAVDRAVEGGGLVLTEFPRQAWWKCETVPVDWAKREKPWVLLWELARQSKCGGTVDRTSLTNGEVVGKKYVSQQKSRLTKLKEFPSDLARAIKLAGRGTYRLDLPPRQIRVFARGTGDSLREWLS